MQTTLVISKKLGIWNATEEKSRIRIRIRIRNPVYGSKDPDLSKNVDPEHLELFENPEEKGLNYFSQYTVPSKM